ncbi:MAG: hypothetical protein NXI31_14905 [bacterium]|nr:hypothetical protein [bacterium]
MKNHTRRVLALLLATVTASFLAAQNCVNLIPNPSFEDYSSRPAGVSQIGNAHHWSRPTAGTSDYYHVDAYSSLVRIPDNSLGTQSTLWGRAYAGLYPFAQTEHTNHAEYLQARLVQRLESGVTYDFSMFVSLADESQQAINQIGALFTSTAISSTIYAAFSATPQVVHSGHPITDHRGWTEIRGSFVANGDEEYVTIGRFTTNYQSVPTERGTRPSPYYYLDNLSLRRRNHPPQCVAVGQPVIEIDAGVPWSGILAFTDPDGDPLTLQLPTNLPDGMVVQAFGEHTANAGVNVTWTPEPIHGGGRYFVGVTASDCLDQRARCNLTLEVRSPACAPLPPGMVGWWRGYSLEDWATNHDGAWSSTFVQCTAFVRDALVLGRNQYVTVTDSPTLDFVDPFNHSTNEEFSIDAWIRPATISGKRAIVSHVDPTDWGFDFFLENGRLRLGLVANGHVFYYDAQHVPLAQDRWTLVAVTASVTPVLTIAGTTNTIEFYVDGQLVPTIESNSYANVVPSNNPSDLYIGHSTLAGTGGNHNRGFEGGMDEVEFFHRVLQPNEIQALYEAGTTGKCPPLASGQGSGSGSGVSWASNRAMLGTTWQMQVTASQAPDAFAALLIGDTLEPTNIPGVGGFGIDLFSGYSALLGTTVLTGNGAGTFTMAVPAHPTFLQLPPFYVQPAVISSQGLLVANVDRLQIVAPDSFTEIDRTIDHQSHGGWTKIGHDAVRLGDSATSPERRVLVTGGFPSLNGIAVPAFFEVAGSADVETFDPTSQSYTPLSPMLEVRAHHRSVLLPDGRVLVIGGFGDQRQALAHCEIFDPALSTFQVAAPMHTARAGHAATVLPDGRVLVTGGSTTTQGTSIEAILAGITNTAEIYDPATGRWTAIAAMGSPRYAHTQTLLADGSVLLVGGIEDDGAVLGGPLGRQPIVTATCERFIGGTFEFVADLSAGTVGHGASRLADGRLLVTGGYVANGGLAATDRCEVFDPVTVKWSTTQSLPSPLAEHVQVTVQNGKAVVAGGHDGPFWGSASGVHDGTTFTVIQGPSHGSWVERRHGMRAVELHDGGVLLCGGHVGTATDSDWLFTPGN